MSTSLDTFSCISSGTSIIPPGPMGNRVEGMPDGISFALPLAFAVVLAIVLISPCPCPKPLVRGASAALGFKVLVANGLVSRRSAREYWWVMKYVWASQNASFASSM